MVARRAAFPHGDGMALDFLTTPTRPYIGVPYSSPIDLCKPVSLPAASIPFSIQWEIYNAGATSAGHFPDVGVNVNLQNMGSNKAILDSIRGVYIDNLGCDVPVYVYFPETNFTVAAQPNATMFFPVFANAKNAIIYGKGFTEATRTARTNVLFTNAAVAPYVDNELLQSVALYRASPAIQRGLNIFNSNFAPPALGDQTFGGTILLSGLGQAPLFPNLAMPSGFYYITSLVCRAVQAYIDPVRSLGNARILSSGVSGTLYDMTFGVPSQTEFADTGSQDNVILQQFGLQLKIDATEQWRIQNLNTLSNGRIQWYVSYTYQP